MIQWVYEGAKQATHLQQLIIATDDRRIYEACQEFGADVRMTSPQHDTGTERVAEIARSLSSPTIINIQGDEPLIRAEIVDALIAAMGDEDTPMATVAIKVNDRSLLEDSNTVKVVTDNKGYALYFSRSPIPSQPADDFYQHIGLYGYRRDFLLEMCQWPPSRLEQEEHLEQLRVLENGYKIKVVVTHFPTLSVDTPEDIIRVEHYFTKDHHD
jgi:3-deoxy-manno-octulosonate cytidylyltransferase (CMP-KDO synthetase)